jgi:hypothetical protein
MKKNYKILSMILVIFGTACAADDLMISRVAIPDMRSYQDLFFKFGVASCSQRCDQQVLDELLTIAFEQEVAAYVDQPENMMLLQATFLGELIGYVSCQIAPGYQVYVRQLAIDPEKYDSELVKELLFGVFTAMPQIKRLSVQCPALCPDLVNLFEGLGFVRNNQEISQDMPNLYVMYDLMVHSKCKICEILYGSDFWEQEIDPSEEGQWGGWETLESDVQDSGMCPLEEETEANGTCPLDAE